MMTFFVGHRFFWGRVKKIGGFILGLFVINKSVDNMVEVKAFIDGMQF